MNPRTPFLYVILACLSALPLYSEDSAAHWAFQRVSVIDLPSAIPSTTITPIDALHQSALRDQDLPMAKQAPRQRIARRLAYHLHGLPATMEDVETFENDDSPNAYGRYLDRQLASPRYGERWARHWMDVARYADNKGYVFQEERRYPYAYTYRDWLVSAFNTDLPYDEFIRQQIAGDHVVKESQDPQAYAAMGFLTLGRRFLNREPDIIDDRIDVVTRGLLGLTVSCARCHDHKFDPVPIEDYYSLYGIFASSHEPSDKPLLGEPDTTSPAYQAFLSEEIKRQEKIDNYFTTRHAKLRTEPLLKAYFQLAHDGRDWDESKIGSRAQAEKLYQKIALRWRDRIIELCKEGHPAFLPWKHLLEKGTLPETMETANPMVWKALKTAKVGAMNELIAVYAKVIAEADRDNPHDNKHHESLRQLLVSKDSPTGLEPEKLYRIFNVKDQETVRKLRRELKQHQAMSPGAPPRGMVMLDKDKPVRPHVFVRGNPRSRGKQVPRQYLTALGHKGRQPYEDGSGRRQLAEDISSPRNPLTARVFVNRTWMHFFGKPMVDAPSDFGVRTEAPKLVTVLDRLAGDFMREGWSIKRLHREILSSALYRQDSLAPEVALVRDPDNRWITRMNRQRHGFEAMRDSLLAACDDLDLNAGGQPVDILKQPFSQRRTIYGFIDRQNLPSTFRTFDIASPDVHTPRRLETMVPQQALYMMNGPLVAQQAERLGLRAEEMGKQSPTQAITALYHRLFARSPDEEETLIGLAFVNDWTPSDKFPNSWEAYAHALLSANEFIFID